MLAIIISWIVCFFVFISLGSILISIFNKILQSGNNYNWFDRLIIGICFLSICISATSLFLPSNHYILLALVLISLCFYIYKRKVIMLKIREFRRIIKDFSNIQIIIIAITIISFLCLVIYSQWYNFDPNYYHYQNIRWNEEYAVVPGLGNLEDRYGFNSNYLLLSAVFSFRFVWGEAIYPIQSFLAVSYIVWLMCEAINRKYDLRILILLFLSSYFLYFYKDNAISDTSTDIVPNLIILYVISSIILNPYDIKNKTLLYVFVPVSLITFKLSIAPLSLVSIYIIFSIFKSKRYKELWFLFTICCMVVILWLIRNIVITGYLIYPFSEIDLFNIEWKMPESVAIRQKHYISEIAFDKFDFTIYEYFSQFSFLTIFRSEVTFLILAVIALFTILFHLLNKRKRIPVIIYVVAAVLISNFIYWMFTAPDFRFGLSIIFSLIFFSIILSIENTNITISPSLKSLFGILPIALLLSITYTSFLRSPKYYYDSLSSRNHPDPISTMLIKPYSIKYKVQDNQNYEKSSIGHNFDFIPYSFNEYITIYISTHEYGYSFDILPSTGDINIASEWKFQDIKTIEVRGKTLQEGFRPQKVNI